MIILTLLIVFAALLFVLSNGDWKAGLMLTFVIGFLQDPLRKLMPDQPTWMVLLVLVGFLLTTITVYARSQGRFNLWAIVWTNPQLGEWIPIYFYLIAFQAINSFVRFNNLALTVSGVIFYIAPIIGLWMGYQVGCHVKLLRRLILLYLGISCIYAFTVLLSYLKVDHLALKEVGEGIEIIFRYGFHAQGASGLWRTSEVAGWHLATAASLSIVIAVAMTAEDKQTGFFVLASIFAFLTIFTGRRKSTVMVLAFLAIYLLIFSRRSDSASRERIITTALGAAGLTSVLFMLSSPVFLGGDFNEYVDRTATSPDEIGDRFTTQGIGAMLRGIEVSQGFGLGVGLGSNSGGSNIAAVRDTVQSSAFVAEGGGGRIILELGIPGLVILGFLAFLLAKLMIRNFRVMKLLPRQTQYLYLGLLAIAISNIPFFYSAGQVYNDPFILIILSTCLGSFLSIPTLVAQHHVAEAGNLIHTTPRSTYSRTSY